jgi:hypothetical protein
VHAENQLVHETGSRYIDFVVPGLLGMNLMGSAIWGLGFSIVEARQKKLLKRMVASPMPRWQYLASFLLSRLGMLVLEVVAFLGFARIGVWGAVSGLALATGISVRADFDGVFGAGLADFFAGQNDGSRLGADESGHASDVDLVGRVLFGVAVSGGDSAVCPGVAADRRERSPARQYAARDGPGSLDGAGGDLAGVAGCAVCGGFAPDLPVEVRAHAVDADNRFAGRGRGQNGRSL